ncbi:MAG: cupin domain-containing protein [Candidatus Marinimicrobia bacterium]|nr:cupin domain-containing protein [Candidatus Neomarinimicrobiota bacterium]
MNHSEISQLNNLVEYQTDAVVSNTLMKKEKGTVTVFAFDKDQGLSEHSAPFDALVTIIDGAGIIVLAGKEYELTAGEAIIMPANIPHAVIAKMAFKMMLVMIRE